MSAMKQRLNRLASTFIMLYCVLLFGRTCIAQPQYATGLPIKGEFSSAGFDSINMDDLNVHISIPIFSRNDRGLTQTYQLNYDSQSWTAIYCGSQYSNGCGIPTGGGWYGGPRTALKVNWDSCPGAVKLEAAPPPGPVTPWRSTLCGILLSGAFLR